MDDMIYWIIEYGKVFISFGFLMFLWPMVIFRRYLAGKGATFRVCFCITAQIMIINTVVLFLGLLHILNDWTLRLVFYGGFLFSIRQCFALTIERRKKFRYLVNGSFGLKNFCRLEFRKYARILEEFIKRVWGFYKKHWLEYSLLLVVLAYNVLYFGWGVFHDRVYGFSDMNVHNQWIYQLSEGNVFSSGIYPEGMHCAMYALSALFGVRIYSCMLFVPSLISALTFLTIYCLMKELFHWRYSALLGLFFLSVFGGIERYLMISMARMQCALPQEFAFPAVIICCLFLVRYLKGGKQIYWKEKFKKCCWDDDLLVFTLAFSATIAVHFYATFMAFFLCAGVAVWLWKKVFTKERFLPLVAAVCLGLFAAAAPMIAGFASGIAPEGSLYWAMSIFEIGQIKEEKIENTGTTTEGTSSVKGEIAETVGNNGLTENKTDTPENGSFTENQTEEKEQKFSFADAINRILDGCRNFWNKVQNFARELYRGMRGGAFKENYEKCIIGSIVFLLLYTIFRRIICVIFKKVKKRTINTMDLSEYYCIVLVFAVYVLVYVSWHFNFLAIIEQYRIGFFYLVASVLVVMIPADIILSLLKKAVPDNVLKGISLCTAAGLVATVLLTGCYHSYLYFELIRYDSTVQLTRKIIDSLPEKKYTIVSPTEELYQVIEYGWHEELLDFMLAQNKEEYMIPTEYVFLFVEKLPLRHAQYHFHDGPEWLAANNYRNIYGLHSVYPEYLHTEISAEAAEKTVYRIGGGYDSYRDSSMRTIMESNAYAWCEKFMEQYPNECKVFYEDDYLICYYWKQNPQRLYNLSLE